MECKKVTVSQLLHNITVLATSPLSLLHYTSLHSIHFHHRSLWVCNIKRAGWKRCFFSSSWLARTTTRLSQVFKPLSASGVPWGFDFLSSQKLSPAHLACITLLFYLYRSKCILLSSASFWWDQGHHMTTLIRSPNSKFLTSSVFDIEALKPFFLSISSSWAALWSGALYPTLSKDGGSIPYIYGDR